jgi:DNA primase
MAGKIPDETLQAIRERVSIVEIVSGYVTLRKAGRNHIGLCPFHSEKTPSFTVNDERGVFHCFGCGAGGTVFTFLMRADRVGFREAVEILARRAGVHIPPATPAEGGNDQQRELVEINETAQRCFRDGLQSTKGAIARRYLEQRGISRDTIERYGLGYCPPAASGLAHALATKTPKAVELGLLGRRSDGSLYDRFWGRVTFPIRHGRGHILGFGGRTLGSDHPKYLNSPESSLFHKGQALYGLFEARREIQEAARVVIVEGYLDALALVDAGIGFTVASLGTALTAAQLKLARRFAPEVVVFFDGDRAGQSAAMRTFSVCAEVGIWGLGAFLPDGFDPDTFVRRNGAPATRALLESATPLADYFIDRIDPGATATAPQRARAAQTVWEVIVHYPEPMFSVLVRQAAERLRVDEGVFREMRGGAPRKPAGDAPRDEPQTSEFPAEESTLLVAMVLDRDVALLVGNRGVLDAFHSAVLAEAGHAVVQRWQQGQEGTTSLDHLPRQIANLVTAGLLGEGPVAIVDRPQVARDCIERIEQRARRLRARETLAKLREAELSGDETAYREQLRRHRDLLKNREVERA